MTKVILKITSSSTPPSGYYGLFLEAGCASILGTTCPFLNQKSVVKDARRLAQKFDYKITRVIPYRRDKITVDRSAFRSRSTIGASYPASGGVFLDCRHCGQTLHLSHKNLASCPGLSIDEIASIFKKAHTHEMTDGR